MSTKSEDRIKSVIKEYLGDQQKNMEEQLVGRVSTIFLWGFTCGVLFAYTSLAPLTIGMIGGYIIAKRDIPLVDRLLLKGLSIVSKSPEQIFGVQSSKLNSA